MLNVARIGRFRPIPSVRTVGAYAEPRRNVAILPAVPFSPNQSLCTFLMLADAG